jgi:hypothetical protein
MELSTSVFKTTMWCVAVKAAALLKQSWARSKEAARVAAVACETAAADEKEAIEAARQVGAPFPSPFCLSFLPRTHTHTPHTHTHTEIVTSSL